MYELKIMMDNKEKNLYFDSFRKRMQALQIVWLPFCVIALMPPARLYLSSFYSEYGRFIKLGIALVFYTVFIINTFRTGKIDVFVIAYFVFGSGIVFSSLCYGKAVVSALWTYFLAPGAMVLVIKYSILLNKAKTLNILCLLSLGYGLLYLVFDAMQLNYSDFNIQMWVFTRSCFLCYCLVGALAYFCILSEQGGLQEDRTGNMNRQRGKVKPGLFFVLFLAELIGAYYVGKSLTTLITVVLFLLYIPFCYFVKRQVRIPVWIFLLIYVILLLVVLFPQGIIEHSFLKTLLLKMGKDTSFSGRTPIWEQAISLIRQRPILGYGGIELSEYIKLESTHNEILNILLRRGFLGLALFGVFIGVTLKKVDRCGNLILRNGLLWFFFSLSIGTMFEVPTIMSLMACISVAYYTVENAGGKNELSGN